MQKKSQEIVRLSGLYQLLYPRPPFVGKELTPSDYNMTNIYKSNITFILNDIEKSFMTSEYVGNVNTDVILEHNLPMIIRFNSVAPYDISVNTTTEKHVISSNYKIELNTVSHVKLLNYKNRWDSDYNGMIEVSPELNTIINNIKTYELNDIKLYTAN